MQNDAVWVDRTPKRQLWINGYWEVFSDNQVIQLGDSDIDTYSRVFRVEEGLVLDGSHMDRRTWNKRADIYQRHTLEENTDVLPIPIIYCAFNTDELGLIRPALQKSGIWLNKLVGLPALLDAIDEAEVIEEDDESSVEDVEETGDDEG